MKNLLLILLIIPSIGNSQVQSFDDLKQINSVQQFKRAVLENAYQKKPNHAVQDGILAYGVNWEKKSEDYLNGIRIDFEPYYWSYFYAVYFTEDTKYDFKGEWYFTFDCPNLKKELNANCIYDKIVEEIKKQCKFYKVFEFNGKEVILYGCPGSSYKGKIGFYIDTFGIRKIRHFTSW